MKERHTPGPWRWTGQATPKLTSEAGDILRVDPMYRDHEANARLIAAAPQLLEALRAMVATWRIPDGADAEKYAKIWNDARAAIRLATEGSDGR